MVEIRTEEMGQGRLMGIDYGRKRSGLALSDSNWRVAVPLKTIGSATWGLFYDGIKWATTSHTLYGFVLGLPHDLDGKETSSCQHIRAWGKKLQTSFHKPVFFCDERFSTSAAKQNIKQRYEQQRDGTERRRHIKGGWKKQRESGVIDALAATWMLQTFLDTCHHGVMTERRTETHTEGFEGEQTSCN